MKKCMLVIFMSLLAIMTYSQTTPVLAPTPPMGWNSWNLVEGNISEKIIFEIADAMAANGMRDAGYQYIIIDDFWVGGRDAHNRLYPDPVRFPNGMKAVADYVHDKGLKLGIYSDAAEMTCGGVMASYGFENEDAAVFAEWGVDYLKYDYCHAPVDAATAFTRYKKMGDALKATGRPIVFAVCEWGQRQPWLWAKATGGNLWRTTYDSRDTWQSNDLNLCGIMDIFDQQEGLQQYAGPGGWNDPDMLMVGLWGKGKSSSPDQRFKGCTAMEYRTHFALWAMLAAPLIVNFDVRNMDSITAAIILNKEIIAIDQDPLGAQGYTLLRKGELQVLRKKLSGGDEAICVFNRSGKNLDFSLNTTLELDLWFPHTARDIYGNKDLGPTTAIKGTLSAHECRVYRFRRTKSK